MTRQPNVLIFMVDQLRYDACGCFGSQVCRTPNLDRLADEGIRFTHAFTSTPVCTPARASLWTGLWPTRHGLLANTHWRNPIVKSRLDEGIQTLPNLFQSAGYQTAYFGKWHVGPDSDLPRVGFDHVVTAGDYRKALDAAGKRFETRDVIARRHIVANYTYAGITTADGDDFRESWLCARAADWLRDQASRHESPFFACISLPGPHPGYVVPERYAAQYDPATTPVWPNLNDSLEGKPRVHRLHRDVVSESGTLTEAEWRTCIARYYAFVTLIDEQLGRVLRTLDEIGRADDTLVLFITDHGDLIGAHQLWDKGPFMYDEQIHIPMVVRWPGAVAPGTICDAMVSFLDLMPTLADAAGLALRDRVDGRSLLPFLGGRAVPDWPDDVFVQYHGSALTLYTVRGLRSRRYKYVYYPYDQDELYDLEADPWELRNRGNDPAYAEVLQDLKARMAVWMEQAGDVTLEWNLGVTTPRPGWG